MMDILTDIKDGADALKPYLDGLEHEWELLQRQNDQLRIARDLLLPRLMSGELAV